MKKPQLPVLTSLINLCKRENIDFKNIMFVCVQHLVDTSVNLFQAIIDLGAKPNNIFILGKHYSQSLHATHQLLNLGIYLQPISPQKKLGDFCSVFNKDITALWLHVLTQLKNCQISLIIVLDDGGRCLTNVPLEIIRNYNLVGIEQTSSGLLQPKYKQLNFPIIQVAASAAKKKLESPFIADAIANRISPYLQSIKRTAIFGIVGTGAIGQAVIGKLQKFTHSVFYYDIEQKNRSILGVPLHSFSELIEKADVILGCTGTDIFKNTLIESLLKGKKLFISCSSEDKEFISLLNWLNDKKLQVLSNPLDDIEIRINHDEEWKILRGGFPINFYHKNEIEPPEHIQLTRGLLLCGIMQATLVGKYLSFRNKNIRLKLSPKLQQFVAFEWGLHLTPQYSHTLLSNFKDIKWINENSNGETIYKTECNEEKYNFFLSNTDQL